MLSTNYKITFGIVLLVCVIALIYIINKDKPPPPPPPPSPPSPPSPPPSPPLKPGGDYSCNESGLCVMDKKKGTMTYSGCVESCQGARSIGPVPTKTVQNCKNSQGIPAGINEGTFQGCKQFNPDCCFDPTVVDSDGKTAWCYQPADGNVCSTFLADDCDNCGVECGNPINCAQKQGCCFDYNALNSKDGHSPAWCYKMGEQTNCRDKYPPRTAPETYYSFQRVIDVGGVVPPTTSQMDAVPGSVLDDGMTPIYKNSDGRYLIDWDCSSGMMCGNSWGKPSDQARIFVNLLALDSDNAFIQNKDHRVAYITSCFYQSEVADTQSSQPAGDSAWQLSMFLNGPGIPGGSGGCLGYGKPSGVKTCKPLNVWNGNSMIYNSGFMVFPGNSFGVKQTLYGHYGSTYGYSSLSLIIPKSSNILTANKVLPQEDTGFVLVENRQNLHQLMHQGVLYHILNYARATSLSTQLLNALEYVYASNKYGTIGSGDLSNGYSYTLGYCTISGTHDSATVVVKDGKLVISQDGEPGYFYGSGTKPITAMMVINALSQKMPQLNGADFVKTITGDGSEISKGQGALTLGKSLTLGPDRYYEVIKDQPKSIKDWINIFFSPDGCKYHGLTQDQCPSNICDTVSNTGCTPQCTCPVPNSNNILQNDLSIYDLTCMRAGIPDVDTNTINPYANNKNIILTRFRPTPSEQSVLQLKTDWQDDTLEQWAVRSHALGPLEYLFELVGLDWLPGWSENTPNTPNMTNPSIPPASYTSSGFTLLGSLLWVLATEGGGDWMSIDLNNLYLPTGLQTFINFAGTSGNGGNTYIRRKGT